MQQADQRVKDRKVGNSRRRKDGWSPRAARLAETMRAMCKVVKWWDRGKPREDIVEWLQKQADRGLQLGQPGAQEPVRKWEKWARDMEGAARETRKSLHGAERRKEREKMQRVGRAREQKMREEQGQYIRKVLKKGGRSSPITEVLVEAAEGVN
jgi:hypothetical protein